MTHAKKLLSLLLVLALVLSLAPMAFAAEGDETEQAPAVETAEEVPAEETAEEAAEPVEIAEDAEDEAEPVEADLDAAPLLGDVAMSGSCGESLNWTLEENGTEEEGTWWETGEPVTFRYYTLTLTGSGAMYDYTGGVAPWNVVTSTLDSNNPGYKHIINGSLAFPDGVTYIGARALRGCGVESITIPDSVTAIGISAFDNCTALTDINIPSSITALPDGLFWAAKHLETITLPDSITSIGASTFRSCVRLTSINWPSSLTSIGDSAFQNTGLTSLVMPSGVTYAGNAFKACPNLASVTLPSDMTVVPGYLFSGDTALETVILPDGLREIGERAFGSTAIKCITLPESLTAISTEAFASCDKLESIRIPGSVTWLGSNAFSGTTSLHSVDLTAFTDANPPVRSASFAGLGTAAPVFYIRMGRSVNYLPSGAVVAVVPDGMSLGSFVAGALETPTIYSATHVFSGWYSGENGTGTAYDGSNLTSFSTWYGWKRQVTTELQIYLDDAFTGVSSATTVSLANESYSGSTTVSGVLTLLNTSEYLVTVDLAGKTVTADGLAVFGNVAIIDSVGGGKLVVPQNRIYLTTGNGSSTGAGYLPIWDADNSAYRFCSTTLTASDWAESTASLARYYVQLGYTGTTLQTLMAGKETSGTGVTVLFRMSWNTAIGEASQEFVFNSAQTKLGATGASEGVSGFYVLTINGANSLTTSDSRIKITPILRYSGSCVTEIKGTEYTLSLA